MQILTEHPQCARSQDNPFAWVTRVCLPGSLRTLWAHTARKRETGSEDSGAKSNEQRATWRPCRLATAHQINELTKHTNTSLNFSPVGQRTQEAWEGLIWFGETEIQVPTQPLCSCAEHLHLVQSCQPAAPLGTTLPPPAHTSNILKTQSLLQRVEAQRSSKLRSPSICLNRTGPGLGVHIPKKSHLKPMLLVSWPTL